MKPFNHHIDVRHDPIRLMRRENRVHKRILCRSSLPTKTNEPISLALRKHASSNNNDQRESDHKHAPSLSTTSLIFGRGAAGVFVASRINVLPILLPVCANCLSLLRPAGVNAENNKTNHAERTGA
jgi:hypothetical protein